MKKGEEFGHELETALEQAWEELKSKHATGCTRDDCIIDEPNKTILHGSTGVTANVEIFWRNK
jgi:hypothetical protein